MIMKIGTRHLFEKSRSFGFDQIISAIPSEIKKEKSGKIDVIEPLFGSRLIILKSGMNSPCDCVRRVVPISFFEKARNALDEGDHVRLTEYEDGVWSFAIRTAQVDGELEYVVSVKPPPKNKVWKYIPLEECPDWYLESIEGYEARKWCIGVGRNALIEFLDSILEQHEKGYMNLHGCNSSGGGMQEVSFSESGKEDSAE